MPAPNISLHELYSYRRQKQKSRVLCFEQILELCHRRLRTIAQYGGMNAFFEIPGMLIGYPLYNLEECTEYVIKSLRKSGFLVQLLPPPNISVLFINWDPDELKPKPAPKNSLRLLSSSPIASRPPLPSLSPPPTAAPGGLTIPKRKIL